MKLKFGDSGRKVVEVQKFLGLVPHGKFDNHLFRAVKSFQRRNNLIGNGEINTATLSKMGLLIPEQKGGIELYDIIRGNRLIAAPNKNNPDPTVFDPDKHVVVVAVRGYDLDMGKDGVNDRRVYDDRHFIVLPDGTFKSFAGNTDPNGFRKGSGFGRGKGMACLDEGVWFFGKGPHKGSPAFRQATPFRVIRDGNPPYPHTGYHAINWHSGGYKSTSSLGCQTNKPNDFQKLRDFIYDNMEKYNNPKMYLDYKGYGKKPVVPYILIDAIELNKGNIIV